MANGARYKVQTRYGWFSLDEASYRVRTDKEAVL